MPVSHVCIYVTHIHHCACAIYSSKVFDKLTVYIMAQGQIEWVEDCCDRTRFGTESEVYQDALYDLVLRESYCMLITLNGNDWYVLERLGLKSIIEQMQQGKALGNIKLRKMQLFFGTDNNIRRCQVFPQDRPGTYRFCDYYFNTTKGQRRLPVMFEDCSIEEILAIEV